MSKKLSIQITLGLLCLYLVWGSTYLAIRFGVEQIPPFIMAAFRFMIGGAMFYAWAKLKGAKDPQPNHWISAVIIGTLLAVGGNALVNWSEKTLDSGIAALLVAMMPFILVLFDWMRPKGTRPSWIVMSGLVLGFAGVVMLVNPTQVDGVQSIDKFGAFLVLMATITWSIGSLYSRSAKQPENHVLFAGMQMMAGGAVALLIAVLMGEFGEFRLTALQPLQLWSWVYLTLFGGFAFGVYLWLLKVTTPAKVSTYAYVNPVIAMILGALIGNEKFTSWTLVCSSIIILAVVIIITARSRAQKNGLQAQANSEVKKELVTPERTGAACECD